MSKLAPLFATQADHALVIKAAERNQPLQFFLSGLFTSPDLQIFDSGFNLPRLGEVNVNDANHAEHYLVTLPGTSVNVRAVEQRKGGIRYAVDQSVNPDTIEFSPGGVFEHTCIISGRIATVSKSEKSLLLYNLFYKAMKTQFVRIKSFWVGPEVAVLLKEGWRLTGNTKSPVDYDLKM